MTGLPGSCESPDCHDKSRESTGPRLVPDEILLDEVRFDPQRVGTDDPRRGDRRGPYLRVRMQIGPGEPERVVRVRVRRKLHALERSGHGPTAVAPDAAGLDVAP